VRACALAIETFKHTSAYVSIRQHTSACVSIRRLRACHRDLQAAFCVSGPDTQTHLGLLLLLKSGAMLRDCGLQFVNGKLLVLRGGVCLQTLACCASVPIEGRMVHIRLQRQYERRRIFSRRQHTSAYVSRHLALLRDPFAVLRACAKLETQSCVAARTSPCSFFASCCSFKSEPASSPTARRRRAKSCTTDLNFASSDALSAVRA
jgi:hypothetical protein